MKKIIKFFPITVVVVASIFIAKAILTYYDQVVIALNSIAWSTIFTSGLFYLGYIYMRALSWHSVLRALRQKPQLTRSLNNFFVGEATRYIPGNIWSFLGRGYLTAKQGTSKTIITIAFTIEISSMLLVTSILSLPVLITNFYRFQKYSFLIVGVFLILILINGFYFRKKLTSILFRVNNVEHKKNYLLSLINVFVYHVVAWTLFSIGTYVLVLEFNPAIPFFTFISIPIFAWLVGYLSIITPMGLGVREGVMVALLSTGLNVGQATVVVLLARALLISAETVNVSAWLYFQQRTVLKRILKAVVRRWDLVMLTFLIIGYIVILSTLSILRHNAFASNFDLANMNQTVWNTIHGRFFELTGAGGTVSRFSIHADLILVLLSPLYLVWDNSRILMITDSVALALGSIPLYLLSRRVIKNKILSLVIVATYLLNPGMQWSDIYDFHGVIFAIPFLISAFYFAYSASEDKSSAYLAYIRRWKWFMVFIALALTTKEEISLFVAMMGLFIAFVFHERKIGLITFLIGTTWFALMVFLIIPYFSPTGQHWAWNWYDYLLPNTRTALSMEATTTIDKFIFNQDTKDYYLLLLKPFGFLPLLGLPWLLLALPELTINILSVSPAMRTIIYHYDSGITPALTIATIFGIRNLFWLLNKIKVPIALQVYGLSALLLFTAIRVNYHYSPLPINPACWCYVYHVTDEDKAFLQVLRTIPNHASVSSSREIRPHVARREHSFTFPEASNSAQYVALIDQNREYGNYNPKILENQVLKNQVFLETHELISHIGHFYLFRKE